MKIIKLVDGYCRRKIPTVNNYRYMTIHEVKSLKYGDHVEFISNKGNIAKTAKVNGKPKTWKTKPNKVSIPLKYGLYEYYSMEHEGNSEADIFPRLVIRVD